MGLLYFCIQSGVIDQNVGELKMDFEKEFTGAIVISIMALALSFGVMFSILSCIECTKEVLIVRQVIIVASGVIILIGSVLLYILKKIEKKE